MTLLMFGTTGGWSVNEMANGRHTNRDMVPRKRQRVGRLARFHVSIANINWWFVLIAFWSFVFANVCRRPQLNFLSVNGLKCVSTVPFCGTIPVQVYFEMLTATVHASHAPYSRTLAARRLISIGKEIVRNSAEHLFGGPRRRFNSTAGTGPFRSGCLMLHILRSHK